MAGKPARMPIYYFDVHNDDVTEDFEGTELADDRAAHAYGVVAARHLASETVRHGHFSGRDRIEIRDEQGENVGTVRFDEAVEIRG